MKRKTGFTLIEIIVVLIIVGVLSSLAITSLFSWIERSRIAEPIFEMRNLAHSWDVCVLTKTMDQCLAQVDTGVLKINIPNSPNNLENKFFYNSVVLVSGGTYFITASRKKIGTTSDALDGDPCSNQLGDCYQPDCGVIQGDPTLRSGAMLCHLPNGTFTIGGWGLYQGI